MLFRKTLVRLTALVVLAAPAAVVATGSATPAGAATPVTTTTKIAIYNQDVIEYGSGMTALIEGGVTASDGSYVGSTDGTLALQASEYPFRTWTTIYTTGASSMFTHAVEPRISTRYRLVYSGFTAAATDTSAESYVASTSAPSSVQAVSRKTSIAHAGLRMWGKVSPAKSRLKIVFKVIKHHKLRPWFTVRTDKHGKWSRRIHGKVGTKFTVIVPSSAGYVGTHDEYSII